MILALSRFKVANGMERQVKEAFFQRPHLVDNVPGFLGMETFTEEGDATAFYLLTRWTDVTSFRSWHSSPAHHESHRGIPKGLKLDPTFTKVSVLERLADPQFPLSAREHVDDAGEIISRALMQSDVVHLVVGTPEGTITSCNRAFSQTLELVVDDLIGTRLESYIAERDAPVFRGMIENGRVLPEAPTPIRFRASSCTERTLNCWIDVHPTHFTLIGELPAREAAADPDALFALNNELTVLAREHARTAKELSAAKAELQATLDELNQSYWHLRKIAEVLPMCTQCGKVETTGDGWETVADYLRNHSLFLSHGCCPECRGTMRADLGLTNE